MKEHLENRIEKIPFRIYKVARNKLLKNIDVLLDVTFIQ